MRGGCFCMSNKYVCQKPRTVVPSSGVMEHHQTRDSVGTASARLTVPSGRGLTVPVRTPHGYVW